MKLMTKEIEKQLPELYSTDGMKEHKVIVKFFTPDANWTWYVFEGEKMANGDYEFFGLVDGIYPELGSFWLSDLQAVRGGLGLPVERDLHFNDYWYVNGEIIHRKP